MTNLQTQNANSSHYWQLVCQLEGFMAAVITTHSLDELTSATSEALNHLKTLPYPPTGEKPTVAAPLSTLTSEPGQVINTVAQEANSDLNDNGEFEVEDDFPQEMARSFEMLSGLHSLCLVYDR